MEKRDLYDINKKLTGETIFKDDPIPNGKYISVVLVFIQNSKGEFLIQKRSKEKDGMYGSTGGHTKSGETPIQGMMSEIKEEIGLTVSEKDLRHIFSGKDDPGQAFFDIYYMKKDLDINNLVLQKEEVDFVEWMSLEKIKKLEKEKQFLSHHAESLYRIINVLKEKDLEL